ncbi:MAG TPA: Uma2 family endonuclease [Gemmatimonadota bacterium]|nr:Uma2 family endonuclease [Gemmatimonadota bacterium]
MGAQRTTTDRLLTIEEFEQLPEEDTARVELVRGVLVREPRPAAMHGWVQVKLGSMLLNHVEQHGLGHVFSDIGVILSTEPATVRGPDLAFVSIERLPSGPPERGFLAFAPDLCVEIVSPSNTSAEIHEKVLDYLEAAARLVWVVHPEARTITEYRSPTEIRILGVAEELEGGPVIPGFRAPVASVFAR